jgi:hypothetical protein
MNDTINSSDSLSAIKEPAINRKHNYCIVCKKLMKEFWKHFEEVHHNTEEGLKLQGLKYLIICNQLTVSFLVKIYIRNWLSTQLCCSLALSLHLTKTITILLQFGQDFKRSDF